MLTISESSYVAWLTARLASRRDRVIDLVRRMTGMGPAGSLKPSLFGKFLHMLDDVAAARQEEIGLIGKIEAMEQKHRFLRRSKILKQARPRKTENFAYVAAYDREQGNNRPRLGLLKLAVLWYLFVRQNALDKK